MINKITCHSDHRDLRIYIDGLLHFHILKKDYVMLQSYLVGDKKKIYHIDLHTSTTLMELEYEDKIIWEEILKLIDENI
jgi:hypothetical protein